jgi:hypothetical protein
LLIPIHKEKTRPKPGSHETRPFDQGLVPVGKGHAACGLRAVLAAGAAAGFAGAGAAGAAGAFFAEAFFAAGFFAAAFFAGDFLAAAFLAGAFFAADFFAAGRLAAAFFAGAFFAADFFAGDFFAADFFAAGFFAAAFFAVAITFSLIKLQKHRSTRTYALTDQLFTARRSGCCRNGSSRPDTVNQVASRVRCFCVSTSRSANLDLSTSARCVSA